MDNAEEEREPLPRKRCSWVLRTRKALEKGNREPPSARGSWTQKDYVRAVAYTNLKATTPVKSSL